MSGLSSMSPRSVQLIRHHPLAPLTARTSDSWDTSSESDSHIGVELRLAVRLLAIGSLNVGSLHNPVFEESEQMYNFITMNRSSLEK